MIDEEPTPTNVARLTRKAIKNVSGDLPTAKAGSLAEKFGYSADTPVDDQGLHIAAHDAFQRGRWLQERRTGIGGSDIRVLMGWGYRNESLWQLWAQKVGLVPAGDADERDEFEFGRRMEPMLARWFEDETGLYVANAQSLRRGPVDWAVATIDGEVFESRDGSEPLGGVEFKTTTDKPWESADEISARYAAQCQWQMFVCGWQQVWLAVLHGRTFRTYVIERDEDDIRLLVEVAGTFWHDHVLTHIPPPVDESTATSSALRDAYHGRKDQTAFMPELKGKVAQLREAKAHADQWADTVRLLQNEIKAEMGDAEFADFGDGVEVSWSRFDRKTIDADKLKKLYPDAHEACVKRSPSSRFTVREEGDE